MALVLPTTNIPAWSIPKDFDIYRSFGSIRFQIPLSTCIEKTISMINGENTTIISYKIHSGQGTMRSSHWFTAATFMPPQSCPRFIKMQESMERFSNRAPG